MLGLVEGITEYPPDQLDRPPHLTRATARRRPNPGTTKDAADTYTIAIQAGAILAVLVLYWSRIVEMGRGPSVATKAGATCSIAIDRRLHSGGARRRRLEKPIKDRLFGTWPVIVAWIVGGIVVLCVARPRCSSEAPNMGALSKRSPCAAQ